MLRIIVFCYSIRDLLSSCSGLRWAFNFYNPSWNLYLFGFSSNFLGASGRGVFSVISSLFQLNLGLALRGGRSFLGLWWAGGRLSSWSFCFSWASFSIFSRYCGCSSSDLLGSTSPLSTSYFATYFFIDLLYHVVAPAAEIIPRCNRQAWISGKR